MRLLPRYVVGCVCGIVIFAWNMAIKGLLSVNNGRQQRYEGRVFVERRLGDPNVVKLPSDDGNNEYTSKQPSQAQRFTAFPPTLVNNTNINPAIVDFFTLRVNETKNRFVNLHQYNFSLNTNICTGRKLFLVIVVHSGAKHIEKRTIIRSTYGSVHSYKGRQLGVVFLLGSVVRQERQESLNNESKAFGDIVQGNFQDSYQHLSRKHIMGMHWYFHHCRSDFILKVDDDIFVNPFLLIDSLVNEPTNEMVLHCHVCSGQGPLRQPENKYFTSEEQYPFPVFPPFCLGFAYIASPKAWQALYRASEDSRSMDMDDVFVSGILSLKANVGKVGLKNILKCKRNDTLVENIATASLLLDRPGICWKNHPKMWNLLLEATKL